MAREFGIRENKGGNFMIREAIAKLIGGRDLGAKECGSAFDEIMQGKATQAQIGAFLAAMRMKGETPIEIAAGVRSMQRCVSAIRPKVKGMLLDTCGTGGDKLDTFNISTTAAFVAAAAGCAIAKHGNRAVSSRSGSADVLEGLGVRIMLPAERARGIIEKIGIGFLFAPVCHGAMKHAAGPRRELGVRTIFNIIGPIVNPANAQARVLGVYDAKLAKKVAEALKRLKVKRALVVHGLEGLDEISTTGKTLVYELKKGKLRKYHVKPQDFGLKKAKAKDIKGGSPERCAKILENVLRGRGTKAQEDVVLLNAGAGIYACGKAGSIREGIEKARAAIGSGKAFEKLQLLVGETNR